MSDSLVALKPFRTFVNDVETEKNTSNEGGKESGVADPGREEVLIERTSTGKSSHSCDSWSTVP